MLKVNVQILRTSGGSFQDGVQTCPEAWSAYSCFVKKLKISLFFYYQDIIVFVQINVNLDYWRQ